MFYNNYFLLFRMINAAKTPGIQPRSVRMRTMRIDPHPRSITAKGGNNTDNKTLQMLIG
jgi:hypothetical protein